MAKIDDSVKKKVPELRFKGFFSLADLINLEGKHAKYKEFEKDI